MFERYDERGIRNFLQTKNLHFDIRDCVTSTNTLLKEMAANGAPHGTVLLAREQSAGRGRQGHTFFSPKDSGIYLSILLRTPFSETDTLRITPAAAVAAAQTTEAVTGEPVQIKWVNDLFCRGKKVCGILTERGGTDTPWIVVGVGINLSMPQQDFPPQLQSIAGAVCEKADAQTQCRWIAAFCDLFFAMLPRLADDTIVSQYRHRMLLTGQQVRLLGTSVCGTVLGIDDRFRLLLQTESGDILPLNSGEVLRKP